MKKTSAPALFWTLWMLPALLAAGDVFYASPTGTGNGSSWADATSLTNAYAAATAAGGGEVWMQAGTYVLEEAIPLVGGIAMRGGFAGTETAANQADPTANRTIVSGDVAGNNKWAAVGISGQPNVAMWQDGVFTEPNPDGRDDYWHGKVTASLSDETTNAFVLAEAGVLSGADFSGITFTGFKSFVFQLQSAVAGGAISFADCKFLGVSIGGQPEGSYDGSATVFTYGAAIYSVNVALQATACEFVGTTRPVVHTFTVAHSEGAKSMVTNCSFRANRYQCIYYRVATAAKNANNQLVVADCSFERNYTEDRSSAGCVIKASCDTECASLAIRDCVFERNIIKNGGGGLIFLTGDKNKYDILRCRFAENVVRKMKSWTCVTGIYADRGNTLVRDCHFVGNTLTNNATSASYTAAGIVQGYGTCDVLNCTFDGNVLVGGNASTAYISTVVCLSYTHIALANCTFADSVFSGDYKVAAEVIFSISKQSYGATGSILNCVFANDAPGYASLATPLSSIEMKMFSIGFSAIPDYGSALTDKFANFTDWGGNSTDAARLARGRTNGDIYARGVSSLSPFRNAGREVKLYSRNLYGYLPEQNAGSPWNRLNENTQRASISSGPLPDAFGKPRSAGNVSYGPLQAESPATRLSVR